MLMREAGGAKRAADIAEQTVSFSCYLLSSPFFYFLLLCYVLFICLIKEDKNRSDAPPASER